MPPAPSTQNRVPRGSQNAHPSSSSVATNAHHPNAAAPPPPQPAATRFVPASFRNQPGTSAMPGAAGIVRPEAAGLDPSSAEHFFVTLAAYADALDALPLDLTRSFSDLRELDAVLGSHLNGLTARLNHLTALIQDPEIGQGQRLLALKEAAEEARAYKMGGEDKIRVALNTAETIISHTDYIDALVDQLDHFPELSPLLNPKKHLNLEQYYNAETGKLREQFLLASSQYAANGPGVAAGILGSANGAAGASGNAKKRKVGATAAAPLKGSKPSDAASVAGSTASLGPTPSKKRKAASAGTGSASTSGHGGSKVARTASSTGAKAEDDGWSRSASNTGKSASGAATSASSSSKKKGESSKASAAASASAAAAAAAASNRLPRAAHAGSTYAEGDEEEAAALGWRGENGRRGAAGDEGSASNGREDGHTTSRGRTSRPVRGAAAHIRGRSDDDDDDGDDPEHDDDKDNDGPSRLGGGGNNKRNGGGRNGGGAGTSRGQGTQRTPRVAQVGNAAGVPPSQAVVGGGDNDADGNSRGASPAASSATGGAGNDDADEKRYCFCNNVSYGDMIGCDDDDCEREWFHLGCVGLTKVPTGTWHCEACLERRAAAGKSKKKGKVTSSSSKKSGSRR